MATVNNVIVPNFPCATLGTNQMFNTIWKLTRALKRAGWKYVASSNGTSFDTSSNPANDYWNTTFGVVGSLTSSGASAAVGVPSRGRASVTGLSGITSADKGRFLVLSGSATPANNNAHQIEEVISATEVKIDARNFAVAADAGPLTWEIRDACIAAETYPTTLNAAAGWWCAKGPSILRIPITTAPVAGISSGRTFYRGENVVQASTGAEGEIRGWVFDSASNVGYLVVHPRVRGTGSGVYGWDSGNVITGDMTGSTVTQNGLSAQYQAEVIFWKAANTSQGLIYQGWFNPAVDDTSLGGTGMFSDASRLGAATAALPPGANGNFPTYAYVQLGTSTTAVSGAVRWVGSNPECGNAQIMVVDCIEEQRYTADGSWIHAIGQTYVYLTGGAYNGFAFQVMDDGEEGDLYPYASLQLGQRNLYTNTRTSAGSAGLDYYQDTGAPSPTRDAVVGGFTSQAFSFGRYFSGLGGINNSNLFTAWKGWRRRGLSNDQFIDLEVVSEIYMLPTSSGVKTTENAVSYPDRVVTAPGFVKMRIPVRLMNNDQSTKMVKGTVRYMWLSKGGVGNDTFDNRKYIQLHGSAIYANVIAGPWDGVTAPTTS